MSILTITIIEKIKGIKMFNWFKKVVERKQTYEILISKQDGEELQFYWETPLEQESNGWKFYKDLKPSTIQKGNVFYSDSGIPFQITHIKADGKTLKAKRVVDES